MCALGLKEPGHTSAYGSTGELEQQRSTYAGTQTSCRCTECTPRLLTSFMLVFAVAFLLQLKLSLKSLGIWSRQDIQDGLFGECN